jgi:hypothetical protein
VALGLATLIPAAARADQTCPSPTPVPPQVDPHSGKMCQPSAVTREINDGLLAPRFAPSTRGWVLSGTIVTGFPVVAASQGEDSDDR